MTKIELVNDVPSHIGSLRKHSTLGLLDSQENILANKITAAIDRKEPKDLADIWGFCTKMALPLAQAISDAESKAGGISRLTWPEFSAQRPDPIGKQFAGSMHPSLKNLWMI